MVAPTYVTAFVMLVAGVLTSKGVSVSPDDLTTTLMTLVQVGGPLLVMFRQWWTGRSTIFGKRVS